MPRFRRYLPALILSAGLLPSARLLHRFPDTPQLGMTGDDVMYSGAALSRPHVTVLPDPGRGLLELVWISSWPTVFRMRSAQ